LSVAATRTKKRNYADEAITTGLQMKDHGASS